MRTIIAGLVTEQHLADAALFAGIVPDLLITNGLHPLPKTDLPVLVVLPDDMCGDAKMPQNHWRMVLEADALICVGYDPHLATVAKSTGLVSYLGF